MVAIEHTYKGYEIHIFLRRFINTDDWTFNASVFKQTAGLEMKRMQYRGRLATKEEAERDGIASVRKWIDDGLLDLFSHRGAYALLLDQR